jgi:hypothetical protein
MGFSIRITFGIERVAQCLPERVKFTLSFCIGFVAYVLGYDMVLDFWDLAIATSPSGVPSTFSVSRSEVVILAGVGHVSSTLFDVLSPSVLEGIKFFI